MQAARFQKLQNALNNYRYDQIQAELSLLEQQYVMLPPALADRVEEFKEVARILEQTYQLAQKLEKKPWSQKEGFKMRSETEGSVLSLMCQTEANINPFNYCALFFEMRYYYKWLDKNIQTEELGQLGIAEKVGSIMLEIKPLSPRKAFIHGMGFDRLASRGEMLVIGFDWINSPFNVKKLGKKLFLGKDDVPIKDCKIMFQLLLNPKPRFRMVSTVDLEVSLALIPNILVDGAVGYFMKFLLQNMEQLGTNLDDQQLRAAVREDKTGFYKWAREVLTAALGPGRYNMLA